jgi:hypothetical protein
VTPPGSATIRGVLRDTGGQPVGGGIVTVRGRATRAFTVVVLTAADGSYRAENLPPGDYHVMANAGLHFSHARARLTLAADGATLDFTVRAL